jgi:glutamate-ammonia-ligase adenylyltransferase
MMDWLAAARRALAASRFLQRSLQSQGFDPVAQLLAPGEVPGGAPAGREGASTPGLDWLVTLAREGWTDERLETTYREHRAQAGSAGTSAAVARALRRARRELLCGLAVRDSTGAVALEEVTHAMSSLARLAVRELLAALAPELAARMPAPIDAQGMRLDLLVVAMGKAGTDELNVSSDLDLVFVFPEAADGAAAQFFERLGRQLIAALGDADADGFVFRVDMRLRPHGDSGPLVASLAMLEEYLLREGREWERFAWAKARVISAPVLSSPDAFARHVHAFEAIVEPFVYRKYFDFGAIASIRELHQRIRAQSRRRTGGRAERAIDIKLGRGGIREIEFLAQTFCIMRGGRDHRLRARGTVETLRALGQIGLLAQAEAERLCEDYRFLRRLEHALQYRDDAQTHAIPPGTAERAEAAQLMGLSSPEAMMARYEAVSEDVARSFDTIFPPDGVPGGAGKSGARPDGATGIGVADLAHAGFDDPQTAAQRLQDLLASPKLQAMSAAARATIEGLAGQAVERIGRMVREGLTDPALAGRSDAGEILLRWIRLVEVIGRRSTYFSLLAEYPAAHERVLHLLAAGGWAGEYLLRHPILLDELIDPRAQEFTDALPGAEGVPTPERPGVADPMWEPWAQDLDAQLRRAGADVERQMNILRDAHHVQIFRLLLADLSGNLHLERLADHLSALADAVLRVTLRAAWRTSDAARAASESGATAGPTSDDSQSDPPMPPFAIVAYGKLGGRELGYASDLDLIFVFEERVGSDGRPREGDAALCANLARRLIAWLTTTTSSGNLFDIDLRLRPNGNAGLLVSPLAAFERYQENADGHGAWVWETQALTRARACAGDADLGARIEAVRCRVLRSPREPVALAREILLMRLRMLEGHVNRSALFDLKHDRGGMVDIEFINQFLVLAHAHDHAPLLSNRGNIGLLGIAAELGLVEAGLARDCAAAYRRYRELQHALRLNGMEHARVQASHVQEHIDVVRRLWREVFGTDDPPAPRVAGARGPGPG